MARPGTEPGPRGYGQRPETVAISPAAMTRIGDHCRDAGGAEVCGALLGSAPESAVIEAVPVENTAADPARAYAIPAARVRELDRLAASQGLDVVGFYHSHPDGSTLPSRLDLDAAWPGYVYLIVAAESDGSCTARAWRLAESRERFEEAGITVGENP